MSGYFILFLTLMGMSIIAYLIKSFIRCSNCGKHHFYTKFERKIDEPDNNTKSSRWTDETKTKRVNTVKYKQVQVYKCGCGKDVKYSIDELTKPIDIGDTYEVELCEMCQGNGMLYGWTDIVYNEIPNLHYIKHVPVRVRIYCARCDNKGYF